jgi:hypothetical protein
MRYVAADEGAEISCVADAEPHGLLRIGLMHALAEGMLIERIRALTENDSQVQLRLLSGLTGEFVQPGCLPVNSTLLPYPARVRIGA